MTPISVCIIGRNEAKYLNRVFTSLENCMGDYPHELVFVDTGSEDDTVEIAGKYTDNIYSYEWNDDYSAARNFTMGKAQNDWVLFIDCDEEMTAFDAAKVTEAVESGINCFGVVGMDNLYTWFDEDNVFHESRTRLCNRLLHEYVGRISERLVRKNPSEPSAYVNTGINIVHHGYSNPEEGSLLRVERNLEHLLEEAKEVTVVQNPDLYFQIGQYYYIIGEYRQSINFYRKGMEYLDELDEKSALIMTISTGYTLLHLNMNAEALSLAGEKERFDFSADFICLLGTIYVRNGMLEQAMECFEKAVSMGNAIVGGASTYIPYYNMACIHELFGETEEAIELYKKCGDYAPAVDRLDEMSH